MLHVEDFFSFRGLEAVADSWSSAEEMGDSDKATGCGMLGSDKVWLADGEETDFDVIPGTGLRGSDDIGSEADESIGFACGGRLEGGTECVLATFSVV